MSQPTPYSKKWLRQQYGFGTTKLCRLMNRVFFEELVQVGYKKSDQDLSPKVVRKFFELYGEPDNFPVTIK